MTMKIALFTLLFLSVSPLLANETCSRIAVINYQEVLVDTNSSEKGEGLRFYLEKDPIAKSYLDKYQDGTKVKWYQAAAGTIGNGMIIAGVLTNSDSGNKSVLLTAGAGLILVNFLISRTFENANEANLEKAINEYNKRNLPRIYFSGDDDRDQRQASWRPSFFLAKTWSF